MQIKTSSNLQNDYNTVSRLAHKSHEPIYITENGKEELVLMSLETYREREQILKHRAEENKDAAYAINQYRIPGRRKPCRP